MEDRRPYTDAVVHLQGVKPDQIECYVREFGPSDKYRCEPFKSFHVGPISFYVPFDNDAILRKIQATLNNYLNTEDHQCPASASRPADPSPPSCGTAPICDGTSFPLLPGSMAEAISERGEIA